MTEAARQDSSIWALVLAAGEGTRLRSLTTCRDGSIPKQFCSLRGGASLLHEALARALGVTDREHICAVVAEHHRRWWGPSLSHLPQANVVVQPCNRGTGHGILLPLLHILERDPAARLVIFPSDHYVQQEPVLLGAVRAAIERLAGGADETLLLGLTPEETDPELGYIVPGRDAGQGACAVGQFVEKPPESAARELIGRGALWNAFIITASGRALLSLYRRLAPQLVHEMRALVRSECAGARCASRFAELYGRLPQLDFSRHVLAGQEQHLKVLRVPQCGWNDLGTPRRVAQALRGSRRAGANREEAYHESPEAARDRIRNEASMWPSYAHGYLNLAAQFEALQARAG